MGHAHYKGGAGTYRSLLDNAQDLKDSFDFREGYFGNPGKNKNSKVRNIEVENPLEGAYKFYEKAGYGGIEEQITDGKWITSLKDGTILTMREVSSSEDGSPAVDINIRRSTGDAGIKNQRIHFVKRKGE